MGVAISGFGQSLFPFEFFFLVRFLRSPFEIWCISPVTALPLPFPFGRDGSQRAESSEAHAHLWIEPIAVQYL